MHEPIVDTRNEASESESGKTPMAVADDIDNTLALAGTQTTISLSLCCMMNTRSRSPSHANAHDSLPCNAATVNSNPCCASLALLGHDQSRQRTDGLADAACAPRQRFTLLSLTPYLDAGYTDTGMCQVVGAGMQCRLIQISR